MNDRVGVTVDGKLVGTVPAFAHGIGEMLKSAVYAENRREVGAEVREGDVILIKAERLEIAEILPGFEAFEPSRPFFAWLKKSLGL